MSINLSDCCVVIQKIIIFDFVHKARTCVTKLNFPLRSYEFLIGSRGENFLPEHTKLTLTEHRMASRHKEINTNGQLSYLNHILIH